MTKEKLLEAFPMRRIEPFDGMAVTAEVWQNAHEYHNQQRRFHNMLSHGSGIVTGLEVIASDPPDSTVYVLPGVATDQAGQVIVLQQPLTFDIAKAEGYLYVLITFGESSAKDEGFDQHGEEKAPYIHSGFSLEVVSTLPDTPFVELARIDRKGRESTLSDAADVAFPGQNQIDLRFRKYVGAVQKESYCLAVCYAGGVADKRHGRGLSRLAQTISRLAWMSRPDHLDIWVDDGVRLDAKVSRDRYVLLYLVGQGAFHLSQEEMKALYAYWQGGGTVLFESCRRDAPEGKSPADPSFFDALSSFGIKLEPVKPGHSLLSEPFLFAAPPAGFEARGEPVVNVGDGIIFSSHDYGCLWQGERHNAVPTREDIRAALEWGANMIHYAVARHKPAYKPQEG